MNLHLSPLTDGRFPGSEPAPIAHLPRHCTAGQRLLRMHATYVHKLNSLVEADRPDLADELATAFAQESAGTRRAPRLQDRRTGKGRRGPGRTRRATAPGRVRRLLHRFDRYTLEVFNAGTPVRPVD